MNNIQEFSNDLLGEKYYKIIHKNGLKIFVFPKERQAAWAIFATDFGSVDNTYKDENGKPCLPDESGLFVSISHTAHFGAAAIASSPVGIDVEEIAPLDEKKKALLERFFANEDISAAQTDPAGREFYRFWTRREAAFKAFADKPFYSADPVKGNEDKISSYYQIMADREIMFSVACKE